MKESLATFSRNFIKCGLTGWCMEILFTAADALRRRDLTLRGNTSLWMFPIYGCAAILSPVMHLLREKPVWLRGLTYMGLIFSGEYITGILLQKHRFCPWDYGRSRWHVRRVIRLDFAPYWFGAGLLFERLLLSGRSGKKEAPPENAV